MSINDPEKDPEEREELREAYARSKARWDQYWEDLTAPCMARVRRIHNKTVRNTKRSHELECAHEWRFDPEVYIGFRGEPLVRKWCPKCKLTQLGEVTKWRLAAGECPPTTVKETTQ